MKRVFLGGTTAGTTWRKELIERLTSRGVLPEQIVNPHLPPGVRWTPDHARLERDAKADPDTIVLIVICPAVVDDTKLDSVSAANQAEWLGPTSMFEIGKFAYSQPERTAIVLQYELFTEGGRPRKVLTNLATELNEDYSGKPPFFATLAEAERWIVEQLAA